MQLGSSILNFGPKTKNSSSYIEFLPTSLLNGALIGLKRIYKNNLSVNLEFLAQFDKFLVPTPPKYYKDSIDNEENRVIQYGRSNDINIFKGAFQSFYDALGGFKEEWYEITKQFGSEFSLEYQSKFYFAVRNGFFLQHESKGQRKYYTNCFGTGLYGLAINFTANH